MQPTDDVPDDELPDCSPMQLAREIIDVAEEATKSSLKEIAQFTYPRILISVTPGLEEVSPAPDRLFYRLPDQVALALAVQAHGEPNAMQIVTEICVCNTWEGVPVPKPMRPICMALIRGTPKVGTGQRGVREGQNFGAILVARAAALYLENAFGKKRLPISTSDGSAKQTIAVILKEVFAERGVHRSRVTFEGWLSNKKHQKNRDRADAIIRMIRERELEHFGLIKRPHNWVVGPGAQLWEIGRVIR
ncbi:MAG: hypothetical protein AAF714_11825 [Pseudomonadota bacterium]